jgi:hypothetical protein
MEFDPNDDLFMEHGVKAPPPRRKWPKREQIEGEFYLSSCDWTDRAHVATGRYLILALRIYLGWRKRPPGETIIAVTTKMLAGPGYSRSGLRRVIPALEEAGLIEVLDRSCGRAPRIRVIDPQLKASS